MTYPVMAIPDPLERVLWRLKMNYRLARHNAPENVRRRARYKSKAKWRKGRVVKSLDELYAQQQVYWRGCFCHCGWFRSWKFRYAKSEIDYGNIRLCLPRKERRG